MTDELRLIGPVVIVQTETDPGDIGEPRIVHADDATIVFVPWFHYWPDTGYTLVPTEELAGLRAIEEAAQAFVTDWVGTMADDDDIFIAALRAALEAKGRP